MDFRTFWLMKPPESRPEFASRVESTSGHLNNIAYGYRTAAPDLAVRIERESSGQVMRWDLRDDWREIWPELVARFDAPKVA